MCIRDRDSVLADEDPGNNEISLFSLAFSKGKVGEGQGGNISSMLRIFMNPGGRMGPGLSLIHISWLVDFRNGKD